MNKQEQVTTNFRTVFNKMAWLNEQTMKEALSGYKPSEVHCIEYIGKNGDSNVTKLAEAFFMTRGAISKLTKKLMQKNLIKSYQKADNKKEIYFELTAKGKELFDTHEALHSEFEKRDLPVFSRATEQQFDGMLEFMKDYDEHLDKEIKKLPCGEKHE